MSEYEILFIEYGLWILNLMEWLWFDYEIPLHMYKRKDAKRRIISNLNDIDLNGLMSCIKISSRIGMGFGGMTLPT